MISSPCELVLVSGPYGLPPMRPALRLRFSSSVRHEPGHLRALDQAVHQDDECLLVLVGQRIHLFVQRMQARVVNKRCGGRLQADQRIAEGKGGTGSQVPDWIGDQPASAGRGAQNLADQFAALVNANGPQRPYVSPDDLGGPGGNSKRPATGGSAVPVAVCVPPVCTVVPVVTPGTPGYAPGNATLSSGSDGNESARNASNDVNHASPDRTTHILTGDSTGGGHQWPGGPGKSAFPESWSASKIMDTVSDIATNPSIPETVQANGRIVKNGSIDGIDIRVVI
jgi:hypothetical protein